jgi:hypothetical protein
MHRYNGHLCCSLSLAALVLLGQVQTAQCGESWTIVTGAEHKNNAAVMAGIDDLRTDGQKLGLRFRLVHETPGTLDQLIVVGDAVRNSVTAKLARAQGVRLDPVTHAEGFQIRTLPTEGGRLIVIAGGSVLGDTYGLYWLWDRMRVYKRIVDLNLVRAPAFPIRFAGADSPLEVRNALRHTANWVSSGNILDLVPWKVEPERTRNEMHRQRIQKLIEAAHAHQMKFLARCDEFSYHPVLLKEFGATLDSTNPALWEALQTKYRRLLQAMPELDGVQIRTGELTQVFDPYGAFDVMHGVSESRWGLEQRYRRFVKKMHDVIVDEFDKIYFQRTWVTNATEQHSSPEVFKKTFADDVPTRNLYLSPYMSLADRWYYQPYNPTFNLTPHSMVVLLASLDYHAHAGVNVFPSFPGQYHQGGLQTILSAKECNLRGVQFDVPTRPGWNTGALTAYTVFRLAWNPNEDIRQIAEDFAAIHLGREVATHMAEILLLSHSAYKDGIYVKPVAEQIRGNTLPHLRLTIFQVRGVPEMDKGRAHMQWLKSSMYAPSKGHIDEAVEHLDRGLDAAIRMEEQYGKIADRVANKALAEQVGESLKLTRWLVQTNNLYVKTCFAYFQYRADHHSVNRAELSETLAALKSARENFVKAPGFCYELYGVDQLIKNADDALNDLEKAESTLADAADAAQIDQAIAVQQEQHSRTLAKHPKAIKVLRWQGNVDGKDILHIRGKHVQIQHVSGDSIAKAAHELFRPLPEKEVTVLIEDLNSEELHPFVLEQPTAENRYTAKIYMFDKPPGYGRWVLRVYFLDESPDNLRVSNPWQ